MANPIGNLQFLLAALGQGGSAFSQGLAAEDEHNRIKQTMALQAQRAPLENQSLDLQNQQMRRGLTPNAGYNQFGSNLLGMVGGPSISEGADLQTAQGEVNQGLSLAQFLAMMHYRNTMASHQSPEFLADMQQAQQLAAAADDADKQSASARMQVPDFSKATDEAKKNVVSAQFQSRRAHQMLNQHRLKMRQAYGSDDTSMGAGPSDVDFGSYNGGGLTQPQ